MQLYRAQVFTFTFYTYMTYHGSRTIWSYVQKYMRNDIEGYTEQSTALANTLFLFSYGLCMKLLGSLGGKVNLKLLIGVFSILGGGIQLIIAIMGYNKLLNTNWICLLMVLNGICQSTGWPSLVSIMGNWFNDSNVGLTMGIWSGNTNIGDVVGLMIGDIVIQRMNKQYPLAILIGAINLAIGGLLIFTIKVSPTDVKKQTKVLLEDEVQTNLIGVQRKQNIQSQLGESVLDERQSALQVPVKKITIFNAWCLPGVAIYTLGYICLKGTYLGFLLWLPTYFQNSSNQELETQSSYIASMFDYGTFIGGLLIGFLGDRIGQRSIVMFPSLIIATALMLTVKIDFGNLIFPYYLIIFGIGLFQGGPLNNISGVIAIDLSKAPELKGNKQGISLVSSVIEGSGTLFGASFQLIIAHIGSDQLFMIFTVVTAVSVLVLGYIMCKERYEMTKVSENN